MKMIVGLGNIGREYAQTRHNIGFMVADKLAEHFGCSFGREERHAYPAEFRLDGEKVLLIKPTTYMNESGQAVGEYARFYNIPPENIAVIQDDMDLELGQLRIRKKGSSGGHNGIKSLQSHLGTDAFPRFKIGIGHPEHDREIVIDHVLNKFSGSDKDTIDKAVATMAQALECWLREGADVAMNKFNTKKNSHKKTP